MKIALLTAPRRLEIRDAPRPGLEQPDDVLVRIDRLGVCGSDVHYYLDGRIGDQIVEYPATIGHECAGTVVEVGRAVGRLQPGDRVAIDPALVCDQCDQCHAGRSNTCRRLLFMGCPGQAPGAAAEFYRLPAKNCLPVPETLTLDEAVLAEPLSVALYAVRLARPHPDAKIAVLGTGPIGLGVLLGAKTQGPCTVYATDPIDARREAARECGADWAGDPRRDDPTVAIARQAPEGLDVVFECSGDPACFDQALELLAPGGTLVVVGIPAVQRVGLDPHVMRRKELTLVNVRRQRGCMAGAIELIARRSFDTAPLLTHHFPLDEIGPAFDLVADYRDGVIKAIVDLSASDPDRGSPA